jgi:hypothetical protein
MTTTQRMALCRAEAYKRLFRNVNNQDTLALPRNAEKSKDWQSVNYSCSPSKLSAESTARP